MIRQKKAESPGLEACSLMLAGGSWKFVVGDLNLKAGVPENKKIFGFSIIPGLVLKLADNFFLF